jgi:hypothetical protein
VTNRVTTGPTTHIQAHVHGPSPRSVRDLDDSPTVLRDEEVELRGAHVHSGLRAVAARSPKDEQPPRLDPHDDREPLNVDIRTETSRRLGREIQSRPSRHDEERRNTARPSLRNDGNPRAGYMP